MSVTIECPNCGQKMVVPRVLEKAKCPKCNARLRLAQRAETTESSPVVSGNIQSSDSLRVAIAPGSIGSLAFGKYICQRSATLDSSSRPGHLILECEILAMKGLVVCGGVFMLAMFAPIYTPALQIFQAARA